MAVPGAAALARLVAGVGGDRVLVVALAAGIVGGAVVGSLAVGSQGQPPAGAGILACPDDSVPMLAVAGGQRLLVTGKTADGAWYREYVGQPGYVSGWVRVGEVDLEGPDDGLPVVTCQQPGLAAVGPAPSLTAIVDPPTPTAVVSPTPTEGPTPTLYGDPTPGPTPTPKPTPTPRRTTRPTPTPKPTPIHTATPKPVKTPVPPTPTPAPTPVPDTTRPTIGDLEADTEIVHTCNDGYALEPDQIRFFAYRVRDTGGTGIASVQVFLRYHEGAMGHAPIYMQPRTFPGQYAVTYDGRSLPVGRYSWFITATDKAGNTATSPDAPVDFFVDLHCTTYDGP